METNRRNWVKEISLNVAGNCLAKFNIIASRRTTDDYKQGFTYFTNISCGLYTYEL